MNKITLQSKRVLLAIGLSSASLIVICVLAFYIYLQRSGILFRYHLYSNFSSVATNVMMTKYWQMNLDELRGRSPLLVSFTTGTGMSYVAIVKEQQVPDFLSGKDWMTKEFPSPSGNCSLTYRFSGPYPPKVMNKSLSAYYRLKKYPYAISFTTWFNAQSPPATDDHILDDLCYFIIEYEGNLK